MDPKPLWRQLPARRGTDFKSPQCCLLPADQPGWLFVAVWAYEMFWRKLQ